MLVTAAGLAGSAACADRPAWTERARAATARERAKVFMRGVSWVGGETYFAAEIGRLDDDMYEFLDRSS